MDNNQGNGNEMRTLSEVLEKLKGKGLDNEMSFSDHGKLQGMGNIYKPEDLTIIKTFRFEGMSDPADNVALYLIRDKNGATGYLLDSYGAASDYEGSGFDDFLKQIPVNESDDWS